MNKTLLLAAIYLPSLAMAAPPAYHPPGSTLTIGSVNKMQSLMSTTYNPSGTWMATEKYRFGILGNIGAGYELGQVDSFMDEINELVDILDKENLTVEEGTDAVDKFNTLLPLMEKDGYAKLFGSVQLPLMPFIYRHDQKGAFSVDLSLSGVARLGIIADKVELNIPSQEGADVEIDTDASAYIKSAGQISLGLGYSRKAWENKHGELVAGVRTNIYRMALSKQLISLDSIDSDEDIGDVAKDQYENNSETSVGFGLDVGVMWLHENYQIGATAYNINEPEFSFGKLGSDCLSSTGSAQTNCFLSEKAATDGKISLDEKYIMNAQVTLEGVTQILNKQLSLSASYDLFDVNDPVGERYQNATLSASYFPERWWAPGVRVGYRKNLVGSELSTLNLGLSLFQRINLDVAYGLESIEDDGTSIPRTFAVNLGVESAF